MKRMITKDRCEYVRHNAICILAAAFLSEPYATHVVDKILDDILDDIELSADVNFGVRDIRIAIGRVLNDIFADYGNDK